jgi:hypothetical protein
MMGIETMMGISLASSLGGSIMGGIGQQGALSASAADARYKAQVAENNRLIAEQNARYATQAGASNAQATDFQTRAQLGTAMAAQGASGLDVGSGSPVDVRSSIHQLGRLKTLEDIQKADLAAYGYRSQATDFGAQAGLARQQASSAEAAKGPALFGSILSGASSVAGKWAGFQGGGYGGYGDRSSSLFG